mgnify:CR=1 FL=1
MWNFERVLDAITNAGIYIIEKLSLIQSDAADE